MRILVVEDSKPLAESLRDGLRKLGHAVDVAYDGRSGESFARVNPVDAVILDLMLPGKEGLDVLRGLREAGCDTPVLILTARDAIDDRVKGLGAGADDYLVKPFAFAELLARLEALDRRARGHPAPVVTVGDLCIDTSAKRVTRAGRLIPLSKREYVLLVYLASHEGRTVSRLDIEDHLYDEERFPESNVVAVTICSLREKLETGGSARMIHTRRRLGYVLEAGALRSIERTLKVSLVSGVAVALAASGVLIGCLSSRTLTQQFDVALAAKARVLSTMLENHGSRIGFDFAGETMPEFEDGGADPEYFTLWLEDGSCLETSATLGSDTLPRRHGPVDAPLFFDLELRDGRAGRAVGLSLPVDPAVERDDPPSAAMPKVTVVLARSREGLDRSLTALIGGMAAIFALLVAVVFFTVFRAVRRGLMPLRSLSAEIEGIGETTLSRRVELARAPEELRGCIDKLNELLDRLQRSLEKERQVTAGLAHELRTPLAELRTAADLAERWPEDAAFVSKGIERATAVSARMGRIIEAVLRYSRLESRQARLELEVIEVDRLIDEVWQGVRREADARGVSLRVSIPQRVAIESDRGLLTLIVSNLMENAVRFAPEAGIVRCTGEVDDRALVLGIANEAPSLTREDLPRLTEPFWQKDAARGETGHSGLGLALVAAMARALDHELNFSLDEGVLTARVRIRSSVPSGVPSP